MNKEIAALQDQVVMLMRDSPAPVSALLTTRYAKVSDDEDNTVYWFRRYTGAAETIEKQAAEIARLTAALEDDAPGGSVVLSRPWDAI